MLTDFEIGRLAGIIDGEGCIGVTKNRRKNDVVFYTINVVVANTSKKMIDEIAYILSQLGVIPRVFKLSKDFRWNTKQQYQVRVAKKQDVLKLLEFMRPYIISKSDEADIALWYLRRSCKEKKHVMTYEELKALNAMSIIKKSCGTMSDEIRKEIGGIGIFIDKN